MQMTGYLLEHETREHTTLDHLMEGFQLISFDWRYLYVNEAIIQQSRFSREELLGKTMMEKYPGIENMALFTTLRQCMDERLSMNIENEFVFPDHSKAWFELRIQPVTEGLFILSMDITERKRAEAERKEYMRELENMIYMTSHQLRQPITNITGLIAMVKDAQCQDPERDKALTYLKQSVDSLNSFTEDLTGYIHDLKKRTR
jgi:PAS domain S-box-containing protein